MLIREQDARSVKEDKIYTFHEGLERIKFLQSEMVKLTGLKAYDFMFTFMIDGHEIVYRVHDISDQTEKGILEECKNGYYYQGKRLYWNGVEPNLYNLSYQIIRK